MGLLYVLGGLVFYIILLGGLGFVALALLAI